MELGAAPARRGLGLVLLALLACSEEPAPEEDAPAEPIGSGEVVVHEPRPGEMFSWIRSAPGDWTHQSHNSGEHRMPEIVCGGVAILDHDGDGDHDVFLCQAGTWPDLPEQAALPYPGHALFRNDGDFRFAQVADEVGLHGQEGSYCLGAVAADHDDDGDPDLFVTAFGPNQLYRNEGGRFVDASEAAGVGGGQAFSVSACFFDADADGHLDLYVANYVAYTHEQNRKERCGEDITGIRDYCSPRAFDGVQDFYYHNQGDGTFVEKAVEVGLQMHRPISNHSKGLGVVASDLDADGDCDLYVANDATANLLYLNDGRGHFEECALLRNCAFSHGGVPQAGMGVDAGDYDGDGQMDLWVVHLDGEENALYRNLGKASFSDTNRSARLARPARNRVGFGTDLLDLDHDGWLDIAIAHGHVLMHAEESRGLHYAQQDQILLNRQSQGFELVPPETAGRYFEEFTVARGLASADLDGDGDLDLVIGARDAAPAFLRNNHAPAHPADAMIVQPMDGRRPAIGARIELQLLSADGVGRSLVDELRAGGSYASSHAPEVHFGLGEATRATVVVTWPDGRQRTFEALDGGMHHRVWPDERPVESRPFRPTD